MSVVESSAVPLSPHSASRVTLNSFCSGCETILRQSGIVKPILHVENEESGVIGSEQSFVVGTRSKIEESAMTGCHLCALALGIRMDFDVGAFQRVRRQGKRYRDLEDIISMKVRQESNRLFSIKTVSDRDTENANPDMYDEEDEKDSGRLNVSYAPTGEAQATKIDTWSSSTDAVEMIQLASLWLTTCLEAHHGYCGGAAFWGPIKPMVDFPTRLVRIPSNDVKQGLRLVEFGADTVRPSSVAPRYLILSHCWGKLKFDTLVKSNILAFKDSIPFEALSKTFQDAIWITKQLGYEHIWIDSLCIVQDDPADWKHEAMRMGNYYANAVCSIAALGGEDGTAGCFQARNPLFFVPAHLSLSSGEVIVLKLPQQPHLRYVEFRSHSKKAAPLHRRAWVIQERLLSKRTLYYGSTGLYWECLQGQASEWHPNPPPIAAEEVFRRETFQYNMKRQLWPLVRSPVIDQGVLGFHQSWSEILKEYTSCELTYQTDKLIAIAGITSLIERETGWRSRAGIWENSLIQGLLWRKDSHSPGARINSPELPTWSWASLKGPVHSFYLRLNLSEKLIEPRLDVRAKIMDDTAGGPLQCRLQFRWGMLSLTTKKQLRKQNLGFAIAASYQYTLCSYGQYFADFWPDREIDEGVVVGAIPMIRWDQEAQSDTYAGLVVSRAEGNKDRFQRVGYFERRVRASGSVQHLTALFRSLGFGNPCGPEEQEQWEEDIYSESADLVTIDLI